MSYSTILPKVFNILNGVSGLRNVTDIPPEHENDYSEIKTAFVEDNIFETWFIERTSAPADKFTQGQTFRRHQFAVWGFYSIDHANRSEETFQTKVDSILDAFDAVSNIDLGLSGSAYLIQGVQFEEKADVLFAGFRCHRAKLVVEVNEEVNP